MENWFVHEVIDAREEGALEGRVSTSDAFSSACLAATRRQSSREIFNAYIIQGRANEKFEFRGATWHGRRPEFTGGEKR